MTAVRNVQDCTSDRKNNSFTKNQLLRTGLSTTSAPERPGPGLMSIFWTERTTGSKEE